LERVLSDIATLFSKVIQGSGIGPLMFLIFINELASVLESYGVIIKLYAVDIKQIINDVDVTQLQQAIDALIDWATTWQLSVSVNKCGVLNVGRVTQSNFLRINDIVLPVLESTRDLGVTCHFFYTSATSSPRLIGVLLLFTLPSYMYNIHCI